MKYSDFVFNYFLKCPVLDITSLLKVSPDLNLEPFPYTSFFTSEETSNVSELSIKINNMLGKQAEACFEAYLENCDRYHKLVSNIQINGAQSTIGELDYIIYDKDLKELVHIELACKFYLFDNRASGMGLKNWKGPNLKDSLYDKLLKLKNHQFPLLFASETIDVLSTLGIDPGNIEQQLCLKAFLFIPKELQKEHLNESYRSCVVGTWMNYSEFLSEDKTTSYAIPNKKEWLIPAENIENWYSFSEIENYISEALSAKRSPLIYKKKATSFEKFFVVWWK